MYPFKTPHTQEFDLALYFSDAKGLKRGVSGQERKQEECKMGEVEMRKSRCSDCYGSWSNY
jgi:hypothetical protein